MEATFILQQQNILIKFKSLYHLILPIILPRDVLFIVQPALASIILSSSSWRLQHIFKSVLICLIVVTLCNALRICLGSFLLLQDYSIMISHDMLNYMFGSLALVFSCIGNELIK